MEKAKFIRVHVKSPGKLDYVSMINTNYIIDVGYWSADPTHKALIKLKDCEEILKLDESFEDIERMLEYSCGVIGRIPEPDELWKELLNRVENA